MRISQFNTLCERLMEVICNFQAYVFSLKYILHIAADYGVNVYTRVNKKNTKTFDEKVFHFCYPVLKSTCFVTTAHGNIEIT